MDVVKLIELLRERAMVGRMEVRDKQLMMMAADALEGNLSESPRDVREYNEKYWPLKNNTQILMSRPFNHALEKATSYEEAIENLRILGWRDEWKEFVLEAVERYDDYLKQSAVANMKRKEKGGE